MGSDTDDAVAPELIALLRCPETLQPLTLADATLRAQLEVRRLAGALRDRTGRRVEEVIVAGLVREDQTIVYPIRAGIPILLVDEGIPLK